MGDACQHHHDDGPPGEAEVERALSAAGARVTAEGERMTPARSRVLELLLASGEPVKAWPAASPPDRRGGWREPGAAPIWTTWTRSGSPRPVA